MSNSKVSKPTFEVVTQVHQPERTYDGKLYGECITLFGKLHDIAKTEELEQQLRKILKLKTGVAENGDLVYRAVRFGYSKFILSKKEVGYGKSNDTLPNFKVCYYYGSSARKVAGGDIL